MPHTEGPVGRPTAGDPFAAEGRFRTARGEEAVRLPEAPHEEGEARGPRRPGPPRYPGQRGNPVSSSGARASVLVRPSYPSYPSYPSSRPTFVQNPLAPINFYI